MRIGLFKRPCTLRRHGPQTFVDGYPSAPFSDSTVLLDVQPLNPNEVMAVPEGERTVKRIKSFGQDRLTSADEFTKTLGDHLFYNGQWYDCKSSVMWDHTLISHYRSEFIVLPQDEQDAPPEGVGP